MSDITKISKPAIRPVDIERGLFQLVLEYRTGKAANILASA